MKVITRTKSKMTATISRIIFNTDILILLLFTLFFSFKTLKDNFKDVPSFVINEDINIIDLLVNNKICSSKREARELVNGNAISINNDKITDENYLVTKHNAIDKEVVIIKKGKKKYFLGLYK